VEKETGAAGDVAGAVVVARAAKGAKAASGEIPRP